ncbi:MAG TPA: hypothetical protein VFB23_02895 [Candidatus Acidoferrales bacterium]|nr:hypothetical protein [Candidatus Acidoferrales bacterium]
MESHRSTKTTQVGLPSTVPLNSVPSDDSGQDDRSTSPDPQLAPAKAEAAQCGYVDGRGHRCRMLVLSIDSDLCAYHARRGRQAATAGLVACLNDRFGDAESIHGFLSTLLKEVTLGHIPRRDAVTLSYICQTILNTHAAGYREVRFELEQQRVKAQPAAKPVPKIIWDIPHPPYEPDEPVEPDSHNSTR